ncbi:MAG: YegS/Rv2252/BmrU family lipid kinase [Bacilli bacterium]|nr:YegS/Rv2252/BmrU family lipid kinase [Bacilli bacterium]
MKCIFLYNPKSGKGKILSKIDYIKKTLLTKFDEVVLHETKSAEDIIETSKKACGIYDAIIFSGGDGTFNDVTCGVATQEIRPILGYIPSGTVNDIAKNLKIPRNIKKALKIIIDGNVISHDVGRINDTYFMYVAGIGTFTGASYRAKHDVKRIFGKLAYAFDGMKDLVNPKLENIRLVLEDKTIEIDTPLFLVLNSISVAGIPFNKGGHLNDGKFDIIIVKKGIYKGVINIIRLFLLGLLKLRRKKVTEHYKSSKFIVEIKGNPTWTVDGERGPSGSVEIENLHNYLKIYIPTNKNKKAKSKSFN